MIHLQLSDSFNPPSSSSAKAEDPGAAGLAIKALSARHGSAGDYWMLTLAGMTAAVMARR
jgi:hypothetical protein